MSSPSVGGGSPSIAYRVPLCPHRGAFTSVDKIYLVLEYVSGGELFSVLEKRGAISENKARFYACQILLAIDYLHSIGIAYRDLKLENILLRESGDIIMTDYGFAKRMLPTDRTYTLCGTPGYAAPEVLNSKLVGGHGMSVDWWSYGVLLFELVSGYSPFDDGEDSVDVIYSRIMQAQVDVSLSIRQPLPGPLLHPLPPSSS